MGMDIIVKQEVALDIKGPPFLPNFVKELKIFFIGIL